ncbi:MAG: hypothetical protein HZC41_03945 [Chloroflexi bacterium]|nr:hypothetical protein [Chloroflexota bacterium]
MEKQKRDVVIQSGGMVGRPASTRTLAIVLIAVGVLFLLINAGVFSFNDVGSFFGSIGQFFGNLGRTIGEFFGNLGGSLGRLFGSLGSTIGRWWPLLVILLGVALLFRRGRSARDE